MYVPPWYRIKLIRSSRRAPGAYIALVNAPHPTVETLRDWLAGHPRLVVLTGAGISVESGIPTWRDRDGRWMRNDPIHHGDFVSDPAARRRYWGRSMLGWPAVREARPNRGHRSLALLEQLGRVELLITQNVDRLHQRAGSRSVVDLHGRLDRIRCLDCGRQDSREALQRRLEQLNPALGVAGVAALPDGDAALEDHMLRDFKVPACGHCGGMLMPDVVFFGGTVPGARVKQCMAAIERADAVLAVGSSLKVFSGFRFCRHAHRLGKSLAIVNPGATRADELATARFSAECGPLLAGAVRAI